MPRVLSCSVLHSRHPHRNIFCTTGEWEVFSWLPGWAIVVGLVVARIIFLIHKLFPTTPVIDAALTVMTPYFMYLAAEQFHFSGVMGVVTGGLHISYHSHKIFRTQIPV